MSTRKLSIVIPCHSEEENIFPLYQELLTVLKTLAMSYEIIFVDDGSTDSSVEILRSLVMSDDSVTAIVLSRNFGHQAAVSAGIDFASGDAIIVMDCDFQDPPELIPELVGRWENGDHVVSAVRKSRRESLLFRFFYKFFYRLQNLLGDVPITPDSGDFSLISREVAQVFREQMPERLRFIRGMRAFVGYPSSSVYYDRPPRKAGRPKYSLIKLIRLAIDGLLDYSVLPLRLATLFGFLLSILALLFSLFFALHRIFHFEILGHSPIDNPGIATAVVGIFFLFGVCFVFIGIMGEYTGRIYYEIKKRPTYLIFETICSQSTK